MTVIEGTFRRRDSNAIKLTLKSDLLYIDDYVCLMRLTVLIDGKFSSMQHITLDLKTGSSIH